MHFSKLINKNQKIFIFFIRLDSSPIFFLNNNQKILIDFFIEYTFIYVSTYIVNDLVYKIKLIHKITSLVLRNKKFIFVNLI